MKTGDLNTGHQPKNKRQIENNYPKINRRKADETTSMPLAARALVPANKIVVKGKTRPIPAQALPTL
jgi:hypothetical protein